MFLAVDGNRYLGGANASPVNEDGLAVSPSRSVGGRAVVAGGRLLD